MDLKTAFPSSKLAPSIVEEAIKRMSPTSVFIEKLGLTIFFVKTLDYLSAHHSQNFFERAAQYIDETKSLFEILLNYRNEHENFLSQDQLKSLYKTILLKPMLDKSAVNKDGTLNQYALSKSAPMYDLLSEDEIINYTDVIDIEYDRIRFDKDDLSPESRMLYYILLIDNGKKFIDRFRKATAVSNEFMVTLDCFIRTLDSVHPLIPDSITETRLRNFAEHFKHVHKSTPDDIVFMSDWQARPKA